MGQHYDSRTSHFTLETSSITQASLCHKSHSIAIPEFFSPVLAIHNTRTATMLGRIAFQPHTLDIGKFDFGEHIFTIAAFGNRYNLFGHIHLLDGIGGCNRNIFRSESCSVH